MFGPQKGHPQIFFLAYSLHIFCIFFEVIDSKEKVLRAGLARRSKEQQKKPSKLRKNLNTNKTRKRISLSACAAALVFMQSQCILLHWNALPLSGLG